jgi:hypothetical protein
MPTVSDSATFWSMVQGIGEVAAALLAAVALAFSYLLHRQQAVATSKIADQQRLFNQRQLLLPLWEYLGTLKDIDPQNVVWPDVVTAINKLELIALCVEGEIIDKEIIRRTFRTKYVELFEKILQCTNPPRPGMKNGRDFANENRAAYSLYEEMKKELNDQDRIAPLNKSTKT